MGKWIIMYCIMANGHHFKPSGHYHSFTQCNANSVRIERQLTTRQSRKRPLCWCQRRYLELMGEKVN